MVLDYAGIDDTVLAEALGEIRVDPRRDEILELVGLRLFQRAAD